MTTMSENTERPRSNIFVPFAILVAGLLIAGAIYFNRATVAPDKITIQEPTTSVANMDAFIPVTSSDHIRGDISKAEIIIVDYSDLECPYCKLLHESFAKIFKENENTGKVAWVFRHFPISIHQKSIKEGEAAECVSELGGSEAFWDFIDIVFEITPSNDGLDPAKLPETAEQVGVDETGFNSCLTSGKYTQKIKDGYTNSLKLAGVEATPFSVLVVRGRVIPLVDENGEGLGALPYPTLKALIDQFLKEGN